MNPPLDLEHVVTDWLRQEASASGSDRVLTAALARVSAVRQERRRPTWMQMPLSPRLTSAILAAATVVVVIALASVGLLTRSHDVGPGFIVQSSPAPSSTSPPCPRPYEPMTPGPHVITELAPITLTITLPDSWVAGCVKATTAGGAGPVWWAGAGRALGAIGFTTADPIPAGCGDLPGWNRSDITIGGFDGERFDYGGPFGKPFTSCHPNLLMDQLGDEGGRGPETLFTLWTLDVDGKRLSMYAAIKALDYPRKEELRRLVESVQIETSPPSVAVSPPPSPTALESPSSTPAADVYREIPPGVRQSVTVDGVPLSFSVPNGDWWPGIQRKAFGSSLRADTLYIAKQTAGGQRAEAVVFWTTFPGGVNTAPCHNLMSQPIAADLTAALVTVPGIDLVTGPSDVTLGGHEAKHLDLTVREDLGCDPGYFFTWPDECWGTCWIATGVGDKIGVWVIDVDGKRLVIETETTRQGVRTRNDDGTLGFVEETTDISDAELEQEVQQIVESIRFE
jgi:hypothetical protein